jgi:ABC-type branched-subunit amino acid transport system ATPase component
METTIEVAGLRKRFGATLALDGMTFTVAPGQITGFIGPNGAGKPNPGLRHFLVGSGTADIVAAAPPAPCTIMIP